MKKVKYDLMKVFQASDMPEKIWQHCIPYWEEDSNGAAIDFTVKLILDPKTKDDKNENVAVNWFLKNGCVEGEKVLVWNLW